MAANKTKIIYFGTRNPKRPVFLDGKPVESTSLIRDLGVLISSDLSFTHHIRQVVLNTNRKLYSILRFMTTPNTEVLTKVYTIFVRPLLEYATVVYNPRLICQITLLESPQRTFTKNILRRKGITEDSYVERCQTLNLPTLELRRTIFDVVYGYKIINKSCAASPNILTFNNTRSRSGGYYTVPKHSAFNKLSFASRVSPILNKADFKLSEFITPKHLSNYLFTYDFKKTKSIVFS